MTAVDDFLGATLEPHVAALRAVHEGDAETWLSRWSHTDPVSVLGAAITWRTGWDDVGAVGQWVAGLFAECSELDLEVLAAGASGDLAYLVGVERYSATTAAGETVRNELRTTHVFRREDGEWKIVHRHGDHPPSDRGPATA